MNRQVTAHTLSSVLLSVRPTHGTRLLRKTVVFVTHDVDEAVRLGDRIAVMAEGGHLAQHDTPAAVLARPASDFVADFVGTDRVLTRLAVTTLDGVTLEPLPQEGSSALPRLPTVSADATLRRATAALLDSPDGRVLVHDDSGPRGVLTLDAVRAALATPPGPMPEP